MITKGEVDFSMDGTEPIKNNENEMLSAFGLEPEEKPKAKRGKKAEQDIPVGVVAEEPAPVVNEEKKNRIFKLVNQRNGRCYIDGIDDGRLNPKTKKYERIWLINGVHSIWGSDLVEQLKDKDFIQQNRRSLKFEKGGVMIVPADDHLAIEFIENCRHFIKDPSKRSGSKFEFFEYDAEKQAQMAYEKELLEMEVIAMAHNADDEAMLKHAYFLGIRPYDDYGIKKTAKAIRPEYMLAAKRDPKRFRRTFDSKEVELRYLVTKAMEEGFIDTSGGTARWSGSGGEIGYIPKGRHAVEYLTELALTNSQDGKRFQQILQTKVNQ